MKRGLGLLVVILVAVSLIGCGGGNKKAIIGMWQIVDVETQTEYGLGIEFTEDGNMRYGLTDEVLAGLTDGEADSDDWEEAMEGLDMLMSIEYKILNDTEMEVTVSALFGLAKESATISYELNGDFLTFDGAVYSRVK